jgi:hypothetical protein
MDTNLVGYLLGNLDADTQRQVEARLRHDPRARAALARVRRTLGPLAALRSPSTPPPGLARRTLARLAAHRQLPAAPPLSAGQRAGPHWVKIRRADLLVAALALVIVLACLGPWLVACQRQARVRSGQQDLARIWSALRSQADAQSTHSGCAGSDSTSALLATCPGYERPRPLSDLDSCSAVLDDRWPLLLERPDQEGSVAPTYSGQNVLFAGGQVGWYDHSTAGRLLASPLYLAPSADALP